MKGSVWADPVGQMCDRCRTYRSAARGRFTLVLYSLISLAGLCVRPSAGDNNTPTFFCADRWGEIIAVINEH